MPYPNQPPSEFPSEPSADDALMGRAAQNDAEAFGVLVRAYEVRVSRFALRLLAGDRAAAQDVAQETFLRVWKSRHDYIPSGSFSAYLLRVAHRLCLDALRKARTDAASVDEWSDYWDAPAASSAVSVPSAEHVACANGLAEAVKAAVAALPEAQKAVFILSHYEGLPHHEIARILNCPCGTVASRKHHAVQNLRRLLAAWNPRGERETND